MILQPHAHILLKCLNLFFPFGRQAVLPQAGKVNEDIFIFRRHFNRIGHPGIAYVTDDETHLRMFAGGLVHRQRMGIPQPAVMVRRLPAVHGHRHIIGLRQLKQRLVARVIQVHILVAHIKLNADTMRIPLQIIFKLQRGLFRILRRQLLALHAQAVPDICRLVVGLFTERLPAQIDQARHHAAETAGGVVAVAHGDGKSDMILLADALPACPGIFVLRQLCQFVKAFNIKIMHVRINNLHLYASAILILWQRVVPEQNNAAKSHSSLFLFHALFRKRNSTPDFIPVQRNPAQSPTFCLSSFLCADPLPDPAA